MDENEEPRAKRARTNAGTYAPCPCYNCQGDMQLADLLGEGESDEDEEEEEEEEEAGDMEAMYGLPGNDDPPGEGQEFKFPWGHQNDEEPDPEPDNPIDPAEYCAAFREHPLIRNAYVDAIVQKVLYGANHRALTHQLRAIWEART
ncbi:hypothetical protein FRC11_014829 [Ceratobasidium sp. 423]|nr:hypothetical protein FRC11_014829 [Ceratobasidium sp. 423]